MATLSNFGSTMITNIIYISRQELRGQPRGNVSDFARLSANRSADACLEGVAEGRVLPSPE